MRIPSNHCPRTLGRYSSRLGHYDVTALIGEGGMGQIYQATDTKLNRDSEIQDRATEISDAT